MTGVVTAVVNVFSILVRLHEGVPVSCEHRHWLAVRLSHNVNFGVGLVLHFGTAPSLPELADPVVLCHWVYQQNSSSRAGACQFLGAQMTMTMTMTMTHSEKSHTNQMSAWPYRQECRDHGPSKKNLSYWGSLLLGKVCKYKLLWTECTAS